MSGSLTAYNPLLSGGGVNTAIPLSAGQGAAQLNPLAQVGNFADTLGKINQLTLQKQAITGGAATVAQHLQQVGTNAMLPFLAIDNPTMGDLTNAAAYAEKIAGGTTNHIMQIAQNNPYPPNTPEWGNWMKRSIGALSQTDPTAAVAQAAGTPAEQMTANGISAGVRAPATAGAGFTAATTTPMGIAPARATRPATAADVAANPSLTIGTPIFTVLPGSAAPGAPGASLGPGGYRPPQRPLTQLGAPYAPPGGAPTGAPATPTPVAPAAPAPASIVMRGPGGAFLVSPDKVAAFRAAGYR